jgi:peptidoglycan hydrolase-like protein with peptidoglycan-binding domain
MARQWPIQKDGGSSEAVRTVQYLLRALANSLAVDGIFGAATAQAVRSFQQRHRLAVDGIVGAGTWFALVSAG